MSDNQSLLVYSYSLKSWLEAVCADHRIVILSEELLALSLELAR